MTQGIKKRKDKSCRVELSTSSHVQPKERVRVFKTSPNFGRIRQFIEEAYPDSAVYFPHFSKIDVDLIEKVILIDVAYGDGKTTCKISGAKWAVTPGINYNFYAIRLECIKQLGYALMYMNHLHPEKMPNGGDPWRHQRPNVMRLCEELRQNTKCKSLRYWRRFLYRIDSEIENMC